MDALNNYFELYDPSFHLSLFLLSTIHRSNCIDVSLVHFYSPDILDFLLMFEVGLEGTLRFLVLIIGGFVDGVIVCFGDGLGLEKTLEMFSKIWLNFC